MFHIVSYSGSEAGHGWIYFWWMVVQSRFAPARRFACAPQRP